MLRGVRLARRCGIPCRSCRRNGRSGLPREDSHAAGSARGRTPGALFPPAPALPETPPKLGCWSAPSLLAGERPRAALTCEGYEQQPKPYGVVGSGKGWPGVLHRAIGEMACGEYGEGVMASPNEIFEFIKEYFTESLNQESILKL